MESFMKVYLSVFLLFLLFTPSAFADYGISYHTNITYGTGKVFDGDGVKRNKSLKLDLYKPIEASCARPRPFVLFIHGGKFEGGSRTGWIKDVAKRLTKKGFVTASIDYRLMNDLPLPNYNFGRLVLEGLQKQADFVESRMGYDAGLSESNIRAAVRKYDYKQSNQVPEETKRVIGMMAAAEDTAKALNWANNNADDYCINTNRISVVGASAGSITGLNLVYGARGYGISIPPIRSVVNLFGGLMHIDLLRSSSPPVLSLHGINDNVVPADASRILHSKALQKGMSSQLILVNAGHGDGPNFLSIIYNGKTLETRAYEFLKSLSPPP